MAIINCPNCHKKISNKAKTCSHCQLDLQDLSDEKIQQLSRVSKIRQSQSLMNYSFVAMILFCGGFLMLYWRSALPNSWEYKLSLVATVVGFVFYIIIRIRILFLKRSK